MKRPNQQVFIVEGKTKYAFDAVVKIEGTTSLKIAEEESDVKGKSHTNYAITRPNELQLEVSVSDTVTVSGEPLTKGTGSRSVLAHKCLIAIQKRKALLTVITPTYTYTKMLIETITQENNDDYNLGELRATIKFKQMIVTPKKKKKTAAKKKSKEKKPAPEQKETIAYSAGFGAGAVQSGFTTITSAISNFFK